MKIIHFSDTHLGYNDLDIVNSEGVNQREADFYDAFKQVVNNIKEIKPDYIIHTGDLFHRVRPSNRAITFALEQFKIIDELNIPFIIIAGNHETPRTNLSTPILKIFDNYKNIYTSYMGEYKKIEFEDIAFHTIPHINDEEKALEEIVKCENNIDKNKKNIMMLHCSVGAWYLMDEFGEWVYPSTKEYIFEKMDYVALGHWHGFGNIKDMDNVYYSGSLERTSLNDKRNSKGFSLVEIKDNLKVKYKEIDIRKVVSKTIDCDDYESSIEFIDFNDIEDSIVEVNLINLTPIKSIDISNNQIKELFSSAMSVSIKREFKSNENQNDIDNIEAISLEKYFLEHLNDESENSEQNERLKKKVGELFRKYEELNDDTI
jgi:DNA repair exonuclease SbcCD nuclease subunit